MCFLQGVDLVNERVLFFTGRIKIVIRDAQPALALGRLALGLADEVDGLPLLFKSQLALFIQTFLSLRKQSRETSSLGARRRQVGIAPVKTLAECANVVLERLAFTRMRITNGVQLVCVLTNERNTDLLFLLQAVGQVHDLGMLELDKTIDLLQRRFQLLYALPLFLELPFSSHLYLPRRLREKAVRTGSGAWEGEAHPNGPASSSGS